LIKTSLKNFVFLTISRLHFDIGSSQVPQFLALIINPSLVPCHSQSVHSDMATDAAITASATVTSTAEEEARQDASSKVESSWAVKFDRIYTRFTYTPPICRYDPSKPPRFSLALNVLFAFASAFTVADLYYTHPILNILAEYFDVSYEESASVPTLAQTGYAIGLFLLCPLGDLLRRRRLVLWLVWLTATLW
jgi:hypothetical protein